MSGRGALPSPGASLTDRAQQPVDRDGEAAAAATPASAPRRARARCRNATPLAILAVCEISQRRAVALTFRWYEVDGVRLQAVTGLEDAGRAVVLVHSVLVSGRYLLPAAVELARDFAVLVPDVPGYGPSTPTVASLADAVIGCARAARYERVSLVGNSFGAQVAAAAVRHSDRVERLVVFGS